MTQQPGVKSLPSTPVLLTKLMRGSLVSLALQSPTKPFSARAVVVVMFASALACGCVDANCLDSVVVVASSNDMVAIFCGFVVFCGCGFVWGAGLDL
jgi:hypothetical protein